MASEASRDWQYPRTIYPCINIYSGLDHNNDHLFYRPDLDLYHYYLYHLDFSD